MAVHGFPELKTIPEARSFVDEVCKRDVIAITYAGPYGHDEASYGPQFVPQTLLAKGWKRVAHRTAREIVRWKQAETLESSWGACIWRVQLYKQAEKPARFGAVVDCIHRVATELLTVNDSLYVVFIEKGSPPKGT